MRKHANRCKGSDTGMNVLKQAPCSLGCLEVLSCGAHNGLEEEPAAGDADGVAVLVLLLFAREKAGSCRSKVRRYQREHAPFVKDWLNCAGTIENLPKLESTSMPIGTKSKRDSPPQSMDQTSDLVSSATSRIAHMPSSRVPRNPWPYWMILAASA